MRKIMAVWIVLLLLMAVPTQAANQYNKTVTVWDMGDRVLIKVVLIHTSGAEDNIYSQAISTVGLDPEGATIQWQANNGATNRDVNLFIQGSNDPSNAPNDSTFASYFTRTAWDDYSADAANLENIYPLDIYQDAGDLAAVNGDSIAVITQEEPAVQCLWFRVYSDGQSSNPATSSTTAYILMKKRPGYYGPNAVPRNWGAIANNVTTN